MTEKNQTIGICGLVAMGLYMIYKSTHVKATTAFGAIEWECGKSLPPKSETKCIPLSNGGKNEKNQRHKKSIHC